MDIENRIAFTRVMIEVIDVNDNAPVFLGQPYRFIMNGQLAGSSDGSVGKVLAFDADAGQNGQVVYSIADGDGTKMFNIDAHSGVISLAQLIEVKEMQDYHLVVTATDSGL